MADQLDVILNFLSTYDSSGADAAKKDLASMGGGAPGAPASSSVSNLNAQTAAAVKAVAEIDQLAQAWLDETGRVGESTSANQANIASLQAQVEAANELVAARQADVAEARTQVMEYRTLQRAGSMLTQIGSTFFVPAAAVLTGADLMAQNYIKNANQATELTTSWKAATDSLAYSQSRVGETIAQVELPALQAAARVMDQIASFVQANPEAVSAGLDIAATVAGVAGLTMLLGRGITMYADVKYISATFALLSSENALTAAVVAQTAATELLTLAQSGSTGALAASLGGGGFAGATATTGASGLVTIIPIIYGAVAAGVESYGYSKVTEKFGPIGETLANAAITGLSSGLLQPGLVKAVEGLWKTLFPPTPTVTQPFQENAEYKTGLADFENYQKQINDTQTQYNQDKIDENKSYNETVLNTDKAYYTQIEQQGTAHNQDMARAQEDYDAQVATQIRDFAEQQTNALASYMQEEADSIRNFNESQAQAAFSYNQSTSDAIRNFGESQTQAEFTYQQSRADAIRNFNESELAAQEDYQQQLAQIDSDFHDKEVDLTAAGDALGLIKAKEDAENQKTSATTSYNDSEAKRKADFEQQQADAQRNYEEQRALAIFNFNQQQADAARNFEEQRAQAVASFEQQREDAARNFEQQKLQSEANFEQQQEDAAANFKKQQDRSQADFQAQLDQESANHTTDMANLAAAHKDKLSQMAVNYADENKVINDAFIAQYNILIGVVDATQAASTNAYNAWLRSMGIVGNVPIVTPQGQSVTPPIVTVKDSGGYWGPGMAMNATGSKEWVASPSSTRFAEQAIGGQLTQAAFMAAFGGRGGYNDQRTQHFSNMTANDVAAMEASQRRIAQEEFARQLG